VYETVGKFGVAFLSLLQKQFVKFLKHCLHAVLVSAVQIQNQQAMPTEREKQRRT
jgi:hypothetical protein